MSLDIGDALREGAERTATVNGLALMGSFLVVSLLSLVARHTYAAWSLEQALLPPAYEQFVGQTPTPMAVDVPVAAALALWAATVPLAEAVRIVAVRTMVSDHTRGVPASLVTRRLGWAVLNGFIGTLLVKVLVAIGGLLLVVPGAVLAVLFFFVRQEVAVADEHFVDAMVNSWELTRGDRVELAVLGVVWLALWLALFVLSGVLGAALAAVPVAGSLVSLALGAALAVFGVAVGARAYVQLAAERDGDAPGGGSAQGGDDDASDADADEEEWPDPPGVDI